MRSEICTHVYTIRGTSIVYRIFIDPHVFDTAQVLLKWFLSFIENSIKVFQFNYTPDWTIWNSKFNKFSGEGLTEPPHTSPLALSRTLPSIRAPPSNIGRFAHSIRASPDSDPPTFDLWLRLWLLVLINLRDEFLFQINVSHACALPSRVYFDVHDTHIEIVVRRDSDALFSVRISAPKYCNVCSSLAVRLFACVTK